MGGGIFKALSNVVGGVAKAAMPMAAPMIGKGARLIGSSPVGGMVGGGGLKGFVEALKGKAKGGVASALPSSLLTQFRNPAGEAGKVIKSVLGG